MDPNVGSARIGVGPRDVLYQPIIEPNAWNRWPFAVSRGLATEVHAKRLRVDLATGTAIPAAWTYADVSWRIKICGKTAVVPLRVTALFVRDGLQWYEVFEHLSFGRPPIAHAELRGTRMPDAFESHEVAEFPSGELGGPLADLLSGDLARIENVVSLDLKQESRTNRLLPAPSFLLGPNFTSEWQGESDVSRWKLGVHSFQPEDRRVGFLGTQRTVAYWVGNFFAESDPRPGSPGGKVRLRGTFVFEKRCADVVVGCHPEKWVIVQAHISQPIEDAELARSAFGSVVRSTSPLAFDCKRVGNDR